jgi:hypothetical protein
MFSWFRRRMKVNKIQREGTRDGAAIEHIRVTNPAQADALPVAPGAGAAAARLYPVQVLPLQIQALQ